ncbi:hypothetical protein [Pseudolabrys sp. FHR47]|uniref:hypothetical protein n=1 Tax=Pseudolabrys sp. FHR47 TaxID=2562284 RepID=UPI00197DF953|nr:hypothetical protein [Pseudolabrys sp. FHR47]
MMYRVIAVAVGGLLLAGCSSSSDFFDGLKPGPTLDTVRFESEPPGAEAKTSNGQTCKTPCALALPVDAPLTVTFTLQGYQPEQETLEPVDQSGSLPQLRPNPVMVELTAAPPAKPAAKPRARKPAAKPSTAKPAAAKPAAAAPAPAPAAQPSGSSPWPAPRQQ